MSYFVFAFLLLVGVAVLVGWAGHRRRADLTGAGPAARGGDRRDPVP